MGYCHNIFKSGRESRLKLLISSFLIRTIPSVALLALLSGYLFLYVVPLIEESHNEHSIELSRKLIDVVFSDLSNWQSEVDRGIINEKYSKQSALEHLRGFRFGRELNNYFWVLDSNGVIIMHPYRRDLENRNPAEVIGPDGELLRILFSKMIEAAKNQEGEIIKYKWYYNERENSIDDKVSYVRKFHPWGWIVGTGYYVSEIEMELKNLKKNITIVGTVLFLITGFIAFFLSVRYVRIRSNEIITRKELEESEKKFRLLFENSPYSISVNSLQDWKYIAVNPAFVRLSGYSESEVVGKTLSELGIADDTSEIIKQTKIIRENKTISNHFARMFTRNKEEKHIIYSSVLTDIKGAECVLTQSIDITENVLLEKNISDLENQIALKVADLAKLDSLLVKKEYEIKDIRSQLQLSTRAFENAIEGFVITDCEANIVSVNRAFTEITGYTEQELTGKNPRVLKSSRHDAGFYNDMWKSLLETGVWSGEIFNRRKNGEIYLSFLNITAVRNKDGDIINYIGVNSDLTEIQRSRDMLKHQVMHDTLTALPNRFLLLDRLGIACSRAVESGTSLAVLMLGLDRFDGINKAMGYLSGDDILIKSAERLKKAVDRMMTLARFGGDEFVILLPFSGNLDDLVSFISRILNEMREPFISGDETLMLTASVGAAIYPQDGDDPNMLIKNASLALDRAKREERNTFRFFTADLDERFKTRLRMENDLKNAVLNSEFILYYQPKVNATTGKVKGMESLIRWERPGSGLVSPSEFIPIAEEIGIISGLGNSALNEACRFSRSLISKGYNLIVGVNISPKQFMESDFSEKIINAIESAAIPFSCIELEITEGVIMYDIERSIEIMDYLREKGVRFSLDDFGTGYSSLSHIMNLPLSAIKIDKSFIDDIVHNPDTRAVVSALVVMARKLNLELVVEGVESIDQLKVMKSIDENIIIQGYYFSKPLSEDNFLKYLANNY